MDEFTSNFLRLLLLVAFGCVFYCIKKGCCCDCGGSESTPEARPANGLHVSELELQIHNSTRIVEHTSFSTVDEDRSMFVPLTGPNVFDGTMVVTSLPSAGDRLDLPPSYDDYLSRSRSSSRHNLDEASGGGNGRILDSNCDEGDGQLLPSYEEALVNIVLSGSSQSLNSGDVS